ncbi:hypothetical protein L1049_021836 [Liquidambar formosana]|uniref:RNA polymerase II transcriptional coactivator KELP n=1 Tax=Liquidambar formosana TaxID=63359 RepID=A0AAP0RBI3_LIQFO
MEAEIRQKISETVIEILKVADMEEMTEYKVRKQASEKLGKWWSPSSRTRERTNQNQNQNQMKVKTPNKSNKKKERRKKKKKKKRAEEGQRKSGAAKEYDDDGDLIICRLSDRRRVTITDFRGKTLVSIREYYKKDGKELPTSKGISLTAEQWSSFKKNVPAIEKAIRTMESRLM